MKDFGKAIMRVPIAVQSMVASIYIDSCLFLYAMKFYEYRKQLPN